MIHALHYITFVLSYKTNKTNVCCQPYDSGVCEDPVGRRCCSNGILEQQLLPDRSSIIGLHISAQLLLEQHLD